MRQHPSLLGHRLTHVQLLFTWNSRILHFSPLKVLIWICSLLPGKIMHREADSLRLTPKARHRETPAPSYTLRHDHVSWSAQLKHQVKDPLAAPSIFGASPFRQVSCYTLLSGFADFHDLPSCCRKWGYNTLCEYLMSVQLSTLRPTLGVNPSSSSSAYQNGPLRVAHLSQTVRWSNHCGSYPFKVWESLSPFKGIPG